MIETVFASEDLQAAIGLIFDVIDVDKSGFVERDELAFIIKIMHKSLLTKLMTEDEIVDQLFKELDKDGDGKISKQEYLDTLQEDSECLIAQQFFQAMMKQFEV